MVDRSGGGVGMLGERGALGDASKKGERCDEVGFIVVAFAEIRTSLRPTARRGAPR
jgi:hypothetical protein